MADDLVHRVARRIAAARAEAGITQEALAARLDIATKNLQRIESGSQNLTLRSVERIAGVLGVGPESFFDRSSVGAEPAGSSPLARLARAGYETRPATRAGRRSTAAVPVMSVRAAAGALGDTAQAVDVLGWLVLDRRGPVPDGQFVAEIRGDSMTPLVRDRALCLFGHPSAVLRGRVLLVEHIALAEGELGGPYALKRLKSVERRRGKTRVTLESINRRHPPVVLLLDDPDELRVVGELVKVLVAGDGPTPAERGRARLP
jgi:transcriptional regulator with XRE-family HTH domain